MSLTSVVHHFHTKSELLVAVLDHADNRAEWFPRYAEEHGVHAAILEVWRVNADRPELLRLLAIVAAEASAPDHPAHGWFVRRYEQVVGGLAELIRYDQSVGRTASGIDAAAAAALITAAWDGLQLQWLLDPSRDRLAEFRAQLSLLLSP